MRNPLTVVVCTLAFVAVGNAEDAAGEVTWQTDYHEALAQATAQGKPLLIDFGAEWCGWCKKMEAEVYAAEEAQELLRNVVCVKVDVDEAADVAAAYKIGSIPRLIILNTHAEMMVDRVGYVALPAFTEIVRDSLANAAKKLDANAAPAVAKRETAADIVGRAAEMPEASDEVAALLGHPDPAVREEAGKVLLASEDPRAELVESLGDGYLGTRIAALELLRSIGAPAELTFDPWASGPERAAALDAWTKWAAATP